MKVLLLHSPAAGRPDRPHHQLHQRLYIRKTGWAAIECASVAAGLLQVARFAQPNIWDIAGGIVLARAAGCDVAVRNVGRWELLTTFDQAEGGDAKVRDTADARRRPGHQGVAPAVDPR